MRLDGVQYTEFLSRKDHWQDSGTSKKEKGRCASVALCTSGKRCTGCMPRRKPVEAVAKSPTALDEALRENHKLDSGHVV